jgi:maleylacetoacetate isomerase
MCLGIFKIRRREGNFVKLYTYWRSTSSYRVRIALALKNITFDSQPIHLVRDGGEHKQSAFLAINPQGRVPALELDDGTILTQSPAIIEYLEEVKPHPALLPTDPKARAQVRAIAALIGCDIHPLHNVGTLNYLRQNLHAEEKDVKEWIVHWIARRFEVIETQIGDEGFAFGEEPGLADVYLVPQVYAARRFGLPLDAFPKIARLDALAAQHPAFQRADPANQADAE